jgi:CheY-like chemotaxis protein
VEGEDLENVEFEKPENFPDKFWHEKEGPNYENLVKSYNAIEKKLSEGRPKAPDEYDISALEGIDSEDPLITKYTVWAKDNGISQEAFLNLANEIVDMGYQSEKEAKFDMEKEKALLGENANEIIQSNINWGRSLVSKGIFTDQDYSELEVLGGTAGGQRLMQKLRQMQGEKDIPVVAIAGNQLDKEELFARVADPRYQADPTFRKQTEKMFEENVPG